MKSSLLVIVVLIVGVLLTACSDSAVEQERGSTSQPAADSDLMPAAQEPGTAPSEIVQANESTEKTMEKSSSGQASVPWPDGELQLDEQGFVEVAITPLNLNSPDESLKFNVDLNTHSVDLNMDLATLAILEANNGLSVQASSWDAPSGGHHISGVLSFPSTADDSTLLEGASHLTLKIRDVDAPERTFTWSLTG